MGAFWRIFWLALCLLGCGGGGGSAPAADGRSVDVRLEGVVVRQYRGAERRFELRAESLRLDEEGGQLEACGVSGELEAVLWDGRGQR
ncbi:MAG: hypothetical protein JXR96_12135 [Deltaproteobacteria bacterium]|nr:hypothetical protein [Deltaproteobacteria bacterium]